MITAALEQTVVGGIKITTPATYELTALGGVKITAPAGIQVIAPGGQTQVDSWWKHDGGFWQWNFATQIGVVGIKNEVAGIAASTVGVAIGQTGLKMESTGAFIQTTGPELLKDAAKVEQGGPTIYINAIIIMM